MNRISKVFLACACSVFCMNGQAQSNATWTNDFSNAGETLKVVGRGTCSIADNVFRSKGAYAVFGHPNGKTTPFLSKPVPLKMPNRCRYGRASAITTVSTVMW